MEITAQHSISPTANYTKGISPQERKKMVKEFVLKYQKELLEMWETEKYSKLKGLD